MVAVMYALLVVASRFAPETRARSLEEINESTAPAGRPAFGHALPA